MSNSRFLGILILVLVCTTVAVVGFFKKEDCDYNSYLQRLSDYDQSVIQVLHDVIAYEHRVDTILVKDIVGNVSRAADGTDSIEIKGYHVWGWKTTSNILWKSIDSVRLLHKIKEE